jgi:hypothetical protein
MNLGIVVSAVVSGASIERDNLEPYVFRSDDVGILYWHSGPGPMTCWESYVVWDSDPSKLERKTLYEQLRTIGFEADGRRVLIQ